MLRLRAVVRSLTNSDSSGRTRMHEISSGSPIDVDFGILLDERRYRCAVRGLSANRVRSMNANSRRSDV